MNSPLTGHMKDIVVKVQSEGYALIENVFEKKLIDEVLEEFNRLEKHFIKIQKIQGIYPEVKSTTHHTPVVCRKMLELLEPSLLTTFLESFFDGQKYILNTMGLSKIEPGGSVYTQKIHRDVRSFPGSTDLWINTLIMLDDSTSNNGATWIYKKSHKIANKPTDKEFWDHAVQVEGKQGDVLVFHGGIWHCAGKNTTQKARHIITPFFSRPFIKQQLDYPRAFGSEFGLICSTHLRQVLGYNSRVPSSLSEFYQKKENRFYQSDQG